MARPTKFHEKYIPIIKLLAEKGCTDQEMATAIGVTEQTFNNWKKSQPKFFESLKEAKEIADKRVERSLYERAIGYTHPEEKIFNNNGAIIRANTHKHYPPDPTSMIFWLKNRKPKEWRDKQEIDMNGNMNHSGEVRIKHDLSKLTVEELEQLHRIAEKSSMD